MLTEYSQMDAYMENVWKHLALQDEMPKGDEETKPFDFTHLMQLIAMAHGELKVALDVLDSLSINDGVIELVESTVTSNKIDNYRQQCNYHDIGEGYIQEAERLERLIQDRNRIFTEQIVPLITGGWRVVQEDSSWLIDYGIEQLFGPVPPKLITPHMFRLSFADQSPLSIVNPLIDQHILLIDDLLLSPRGIKAGGEIEAKLLMAQASLLSREIYRQTKIEASSDPKMVIENEDLFAFTLSKASTQHRIHLCPIDQDDMDLEPRDHPASLRILQCFLQKEPFLHLIF